MQIIPWKAQPTPPCEEAAPQSTLDVLRYGLERVERAWGTGQLTVREASGVVKVCALGALLSYENYKAGRGDYGDLDAPLRCDAVDLLYQAVVKEFPAVGVLFSLHGYPKSLHTDRMMDAVYSFNDNCARKSDVIRVYKRAIRMAEDAEIRASVLVGEADLATAGD